MNSPPDEADEQLRYAEYALGVLDAEARAAVEREMATNGQAAAAVAAWQAYLAPLAHAVPEVAPSPELWNGIRQRVGVRAARQRPKPPALWNNVRLWRWVGVGACALAAACLVLLLLFPFRAVFTPRGLMVSAIRQQNGVTDWTATMDLDRRQILIVPAETVSVGGNRSTELWLVPAGRAPIAVGVIRSDRPTVLPLGRALLAQLGPTAALAVSVEPRGGSPTGQPTGPIIATGAISGAPSPAERPA